MESHDEKPAEPVAKSATPPKSNRQKIELRRKVLTIVGLIIVFATFIAKEWIGESLKSNIKELDGRRSSLVTEWNYVQLAELIDKAPCPQLADIASYSPSFRDSLGAYASSCLRECGRYQSAVYEVMSCPEDCPEAISGGVRDIDGFVLSKSDGDAAKQLMNVLATWDDLCVEKFGTVSAAINGSEHPHDLSSPITLYNVKDELGKADKFKQSIEYEMNMLFYTVTSRDEGKISIDRDTLRLCTYIGYILYGVGWGLNVVAALLGEGVESAK